MSISSIIDQIRLTVGELSYVISPILLEGGVVEKVGKSVPIIFYTESLDFRKKLIGGDVNEILNIANLDNLWCHWKMPPNPTGDTSMNTLLDFTPAIYSMGNQEVASNHLICNPLTVSLQMICPARGPGAMQTKQDTLQSLQNILTKHSLMGGYFTVITAGFIYKHMVLKQFSDITSNSVTLPSSLFQLDFQEIMTPKLSKRYNNF